MRDENNNYWGICLFFLFIIAIVIAGTFFLNYDRVEKLKEKVDTTPTETNTKSKNKIDSEKDYIYFINEEVVDADLNIRIQYPVINLNSTDAEMVTKNLEKKVTAIKNSLVRIKNEEDKASCTVGEINDIKETELVDFNVYSTKDYVSLIVSESSYSCIDSMSAVLKMNAYTFAISDGKLVEFNDLIEMYSMDFEKIKEQMQKNLQEKQTMLEGDIPNIKIEETLSSLKEQENYIVYIDESKNLVIKYIVKTNSIDYNDTIIINK